MPIGREVRDPPVLKATQLTFAASFFWPCPTFDMPQPGFPPPLGHLTDEDEETVTSWRMSVGDYRGHGRIRNGAYVGFTLLYH